jgi:tetratricopeptide (TPR) repeat protein
MAHRGLRKPSNRRSLRPRNQIGSQRTAADTGTHRVLTRSGQELEVEVPEYDGDFADDRSSAASHSDAASLRREDFAESAFDGAYEVAREAESGAPAAGGGRHSGSVAQNDPLANAFFERSETPDEVFDDSYVIHQLSRGSRRAMYASLGIFAVSVVCIGGYSIYQNWVMPAPVELGATLADIPAVPVPAPANAAAAAARWQAAQPAPQLAAVAATAPGTETQLSAATRAAVDAPVQTASQTPSSPAQLTGSQAAEPAIQQGSMIAMLAARPAAASDASEGVASAHLRATAQAASVGSQAIHAEPEAKPVESAARPVARDQALAVVPDEMQVASAAEPDHPSGGLPTSASGGPTYDELVEVGRVLSKKNRRVEASEAFRRALIQSPHGSAALSGLGYVYLNADERQHAREYAQRAVQADARNAEGWIVLGAALESLGDRAGARDAYRNCVEWGQGPYLVECRKVSH